MKWLRRLLGKTHPGAPREAVPDYSDDVGAIYSGDDARRIAKHKQADIYNERGMAAFERDDFDTAISEFGKAVETWPSALHHLNLGNALVSKGARGNQKLIEEGKQHLEEALRLQPGFERATRNLEVAKQLLGGR